MSIQNLKSKIVYRPRIMIGYTAVGILGFTLLLGLLPGGTAAGLLLLGLGLAGVGWHARLSYLTYQAQRARQAAAEAKALVQAQRRERAQRQKQQRQQQREAEQVARARQAAALRMERETVQQRREHEIAERMLRVRRMEQEAARIRRLTDSELHIEMRALFTRRSMQAAEAGAENPGDLLLTSCVYPAGALARCLPVEQRAGAADVQALEAIRRDTGAQHTFLIALAGFTPAAVRLAQHLPMTLVESHLLTSWKENVTC